MIDEAPADTAPAPSADTAPEQGTTPVQEAVTTEQAFSLPEAYKDKPWAEKIKSHEDAFKQIDNLTSLVGKKTIGPIDYETASTEEIASHHASLAPEDASAYSFGEGADPEFSKALAGVFKENGLTVHQANDIITKVNDISSGIFSARQEADTDADTYIEMMKESFGDSYETTSGEVEAALKELASDEDKTIFDKVDNKTRAAVDRTVHAMQKAHKAEIAEILKKHGATETGAQVQGDHSPPSVNINNQIGEINKQLAAMDKRPHTAQEKADLIAQRHSLFERKVK